MCSILCIKSSFIIRWWWWTKPLEIKKVDVCSTFHSNQSIIVNKRQCLVAISSKLTQFIASLVRNWIKPIFNKCSYNILLLFWQKKSFFIQLKPYIERIHQMSCSSLSDNGMLQIFSCYIKWLMELFKIVPAYS